MSDVHDADTQDTVLARRAGALRDRTERVPPPAPVPYLQCATAGRRVALPFADVVRVEARIRDIRLPGAPADWVGVVSVDDEVLPVHDRSTDASSAYVVVVSADDRNFAIAVDGPLEIVSTLPGSAPGEVAPLTNDGTEVVRAYALIDPPH